MIATVKFLVIYSILSLCVCDILAYMRLNVLRKHKTKHVTK